MSKGNKQVPKNIIEEKGLLRRLSKKEWLCIVAVVTVVLGGYGIVLGTRYSSNGELLTAKSSIKYLEQKLADTEKVRDAAEKQVKYIRDGKVALEKEFDAVQAKKNMLEKQLVNAKEKNDTLAKQLVDVKEKNDALVKQLADVKEKNDTLEKQLVDAKEKNDAVDEQLADTEHKLAESEKQLKTLLADNAILKTNLSNESKTNTQKIETLISETVKLTKERDDALSKNRELEGDIAKIEGVASSSTEIKDVRNALEIIEFALRDEPHAQDLMEQLAMVRQSLTKLEKAYTSEIADIRDIMIGVREENKKLEDIVSKLRYELRIASYKNQSRSDNTVSINDDVAGFATTSGNNVNTNNASDAAISKVD